MAWELCINSKGRPREELCERREAQDRNEPTEKVPTTDNAHGAIPWVFTTRSERTMIVQPNVWVAVL